MTATLLRKISPATVFPEGLPRLDVEKAPKEFHLYNVYGIASGTKSGTTDKGEWLSFKGQFEAVKEDGQIYASAQVFLPQPFEDMLLAQLVRAQEADEKASVQFAVRVYLVPPKAGKPSSTGYEYRCEPLIEAAETSPLSALRNQVRERIEKGRLLASPDAKVEPAPAKDKDEAPKPNRR